MSGKTPILSEKELEELAAQAQIQLDKDDDILALETMLRMSSKEDLVKYLQDHPVMLPPLEKAINDDIAKNQVTKAAKEAAKEARKATITKRREGEGRKLYKTMKRKAKKSRKARKARKSRKSRKARKN